MDNTPHDPQDMTVSISHMPADVDEDTGLANTGKGVAYWLTMSIPADRACLDLSQGRLTVETRLTAAQLSRIGGFITDEAGKENDYLAGYAALAAAAPDSPAPKPTPPRPARLRHAWHHDPAPPRGIRSDRPPRRGRHHLGPARRRIRHGRRARTRHPVRHHHTGQQHDRPSPLGNQW